MKKILLTLLLASGITSSAFADSQEIRRSAPQKELGRYDAIQRDILDFILFEHIGSRALSSENEAFIRSIQKEMNMTDWNIEIRAISKTAKMILGEKNAVAFGQLFPGQRLNYLYISESWFNTLSDKAKRFLIGHELTHIKHNHIPQKVILGGIAGAITNQIFALEFLQKNALHLKIGGVVRMDAIYNGQPQSIIPTRYHYFTYSVLYTITYNLLKNYISRTAEIDADLNAATELICADGGVELANDLIGAPDPESRFAPIRVVNAATSIALTPIKKAYHLVFGSHPETEIRKAYLEKLAQEQAAATEPTA